MTADDFHTFAAQAILIGVITVVWALMAIDVLGIIGMPFNALFGALLVSAALYWLIR